MWLTAFTPALLPSVKILTSDLTSIISFFCSTRSTALLCSTAALRSSPHLFPPPRRGGDFLCCLSSTPFIFSGRLAHFLSSDIGQMVIFIVRFMISPHHKDNLEPLRTQSPQGLVMAVSLGSLVAIVMVRPLTAIKRTKRQPVRGVSQYLVTGKTKLHHTAFAAGFGRRHYSRLRLQVAKGLPATLGISQLSPQGRYDGARFCSRQRLDKFSRRHRGEKTFDP